MTSKCDFSLDRSEEGTVTERVLGAGFGDQLRSLVPGGREY